MRDTEICSIVFPCQTVKDFGFVEKLGAFILDILKFDGHLYVVFIMQGHENLPEGARP